MATQPPTLAQAIVAQTIAEELGETVEKVLGWAAAAETRRVRHSAYGRAYIYASESNDSLLDYSNMDAFEKLLVEQGFSDDVERLTRTLLVRAFDDDGNFTKAGAVTMKIRDQLDRYPVLDDDDYSQREYDAMIDAIEHAAMVHATLSRKDAQRVFSWLWEHKQDMMDRVDRDAPYLRGEQVYEALSALGIVTDEDEA